MVNQKIIIIGEEDIVLMFGLLGIEGHIMEENEQFIKYFTDLIQDPNVGMIFIALDLSDDNLEYVLDYKLNNLEPFVFYMPNIFLEEENDKFLKGILKTIKKFIT